MWIEYLKNSREKSKSYKQLSSTRSVEVDELLVAETQEKMEKLVKIWVEEIERRNMEINEKYKNKEIEIVRMYRKTSLSERELEKVTETTLYASKSAGHLDKKFK